jgi:hypothetical protein
MSMKTLFIGSIPGHEPGTGQTPKASDAALFQAARELGYEAARRNHILFLGSDSPNTIDAYIAEGLIRFCNENPDLPRQLYVHRPNDSQVPFLTVPSNLDVQRQYYHEDNSAPHKWIVTHVRALDACDCVVAVSGGASTRIVGNIAADRQKPIVAVGSFGGASRELFDRLIYLYKSRVADATTVQCLVQPWSKQSAEKVIGFVEILAASGAPRQHLYFLSYSWNDSAAADHLETLLWRNGRRVFRDENNLRTGDTMSSVIETLIKQCDTFVAVWGESYHKSTWCPGELQRAIDLKATSGRPTRIVDHALIEIGGVDRTEPSGVNK